MKIKILLMFICFNSVNSMIASQADSGRLKTSAYVTLATYTATSLLEMKYPTKNSDIRTIGGLAITLAAIMTNEDSLSCVATAGIVGLNLYTRRNCKK